MLETQYIASRNRHMGSYAVLKEQPADEKLVFFSFLNPWTHFLTTNCIKCSLENSVLGNSIQLIIIF